MTKADKVVELAENAMKRMMQSAKSPGDNLRMMAIVRKFRKDVDGLSKAKKSQD